MPVSSRIRRRIVRLARAAGRRLDPDWQEPDPAWPHLIRLDHPPSAEVKPRYGYGRPAHAGLEAILARGDDTYRSELTELASFAEDLLRIPRHPGVPGEPCWINNWLVGMDTVSLYGYLRRWKPARYVEVGSGQTTLVAARARRDGDLPTRIVSIDPHPRAEVDAVCDEVIRQPLELTDLGAFGHVAPGDVVFLDSSHRVFMNSDMVAFYLDVLPSLPSGVLVGIHDILWPDDYLPEWRDYWFSEQYLLAAYLLAETPWIKPLLASSYVAGKPDLATVLDPLWSHPHLDGVDHRGFAFWFTIERRPAR